MVQVLDCTLRDGGYYTNWDFDPEAVRTYLTSIARLPISYVEIGYVNDPAEGYFGEYYFLTEEKLRSVRAILRPDQKLVVMIDGKNYKPDRLGALFRPIAHLVDLVRITVAPNALGHGVSLAKALKDVGLKVGFNVMYLSTFQNDISQIRTAFDEADTYESLALVDSYGGCVPAAVSKLFRELREALPNKTIGFHGHDNMCLAFANTLAAIEGGADVVDGTFTGMGRGAGNLRTETVLIHLAGQGGNEPLDYQALSSAVAPFDALRRVHEWGTNLPYMLSGANNLPQKDVMDWISKNRYSVLSILQALQQQSGGEADLKAYPELQAGSFAAKSVLLIGGGPSVIRHVDAISRFVAKTNPLVVFSTTRHLALAPRIGGTQLLCLPGHDAFRAGARDHLDGIAAVVLPAPPRVPGCLPAFIELPVFQAPPLSMDKQRKIGPVSDTGPLGLALGATQMLGAQSCYLAGFDGYEMASVSEQELSREVELALSLFRKANGSVKLTSLTPTRYDLDQASVYSLVAAVD
ncbi:MAG: hypothetical protein JWP04_997 [Belnapia sp.]|nr:hypothetical protein [Belnapia sp.]